MKCTKCDHINPEDQANCVNCGEEINEVGLSGINELGISDIDAENIIESKQQLEPDKKSKTPKIIIGIIALLVIGALIIAYNNQKNGAGQVAEPSSIENQEQQTTKPTGGTELVATIGNEPITQSVFNLYFWITQQQFESAGPNVWEMETNGRKTVEIAKENTLENISFVIAAKQKAEELGLEISDEEQKLIDEQANTIVTNSADLVEKLQFDINDMKGFLKSDLFIQKVMENLVENHKPTEEQINTQVEQVKSRYETATVKHVLIASKDEKGKALAEEVLSKALAGEDMAELAKTYSEDPGSKDSGGEYTFPKGQMVPQFENASFTGEIGKVYPELVETDYGYHIIKVEKRESGAIEKVRQDSEMMIKNQYAQEELMKLGKALTVEKTELYNTIDIIK